MNNKNPLTSGEQRAIVALGSLYSFRMLGLFMVLPVLGIYAADLPGASPEKLGIALGAYGLTQACLQLPLGWLSDRIGRRPVVIGGLMLFIAGSLVAAAAESINGIIIGRFLQGAGAIAAALTAMAADVTRESQRTKAMAVIGASVGLSFVLAIVLGPVIASAMGLQGVFLVTACLGTLGLVIVLTLLPRTAASGAVVADGDWAVDHVFGGRLPVLYGSIFLLHGLMMATFLIVPAALVDQWQLPADDHWAIYLLTVVLSVVLPLLVKQLAELVQSVPDAYRWVSETAIPWVHARLSLSPVALPSIDWESGMANHWQSLGVATGNILKQLTTSGLSLVGTVLNLALIPVVAFYLMRDWDIMKAALLRLVPRSWETTVSE